MLFLAARQHDVCAEGCQLSMWWFAYVNHAKWNCLCLGMVVREGVCGGNGQLSTDCRTFTVHGRDTGRSCQRGYWKNLRFQAVRWSGFGVIH